jgi:hypothetical protein
MVARAVARGKNTPPLFPRPETFLNTIPADSKKLWIFWGLFCNFVEMYLIYFEFLLFWNIGCLCKNIVKVNV